MDIKDSYYRYIVQNKVYTLENVHDTLFLRFTLTNVTKNIIVTPDTIVDAGSPIVILNITEDSIYNLHIITGDGNTDIEIYNYPISKELVIDNMKDILCDCDSLTSVCGNGESPIIENNKELQFLFTGSNTYLDVLLSSKNMRNYLCCFGDLIKSDWRILSHLSRTFTSLNDIGKLPDNISVVRLYTLYKYILLYVIEMDYARYATRENIVVHPGDEPEEPNPNKSSTPVITDEEYINKLFDIQGIIDCTTDLNVGVESIINSLNTCYQLNSFNACATGNVDPPPNPTEATISNFKMNSSDSVFFIGEPLQVTLFQWDINSGTPEHLKINDTVSQLIAEEVSGTQHSVSETYILNESGSIVWTLKGSNTNELTMRADWVNIIYTGKLTQERFPTTQEILNGEKLKEKLNGTDFIWKPDNSLSTIAWLAIPVEASQVFTQWQDMQELTNKGSIGDNDDYVFMIRDRDIQTINHINYYVYRFGYKTEFTNDLQLY